jgi:hypothetical protein
VKIETKEETKVTRSIILTDVTPSVAAQFASLLNVVEWDSGTDGFEEDVANLHEAFDNLADGDVVELVTDSSLKKGAKVGTNLRFNHA